ncbi:MAG: Wzz/FepE/Etk N-terminal domain-containing protein [Crocinitomicaceae bacterium]|nr:Wzz/FepE/Etk N-terminal domain-containing protein [Taishania sp.]
MSEVNEQLKQEQQNLIVFIWKNRKLIIAIAAAGFVVSLVISLLLTPVFKSSAIVFPTATSTVSFSEQRNAKASSMDFGESEQAEQMVQILQSSNIRDKIVSEFDLYKHYEIDDNDPNKHYKLVKTFKENFSFSRTRYGSIAIDVYDINPEKAAAMANRIVDLIDTVKNQMIEQRTVEAFKIAARKKDMLQSELKQIDIKIDSLANLGVMNVDARAGLYQALVDAKSPAEKTEIKQKLLINEKDGALYDKLEHFRREKITAYELFMAIYEQAESDAHTQLNHKFVVERAVVPDKKDKPKRMIVVLLGTMGATIFSIFALLVRDKIRELKKIA